MAEQVIILMDNGSLRAEATLQLRRVATALSAELGEKVHPVSLLHSAKVPEQDLDGVPAKTFVPFLREQRELGRSRFVVLPLFFGPSGALVDYLPARVEALKESGWDDLVVDVMDTLVNAQDDRVAQIMAGLVREKLAIAGWGNAAVAMCDHGSPSREVNTVREIVARQMRELLADTGVTLQACSMERREGAEYDFNEPLLENLLGGEGFDGKVIVSLLFAGPGRHAGREGDVAKICADAMKDAAQLETTMTELVGSDLNSVVAILVDRYRG